MSIRIAFDSLSLKLAVIATSLAILVQLYSLVRKPTNGSSAQLYSIRDSIEARSEKYQDAIESLRRMQDNTSMEIQLLIAGRDSLRRSVSPNDSNVVIRLRSGKSEYWGIVKPGVISIDSSLQGRMKSVENDTRELRRIMLQEPEEAVSAERLKSKLDVLSGDIKHLSDDVNYIRENEWRLTAFLATVSLTIIGSVIALFFRLGSSLKAKSPE